MNLTPSEAARLIREIQSAFHDAVEVVVCPPFVALIDALETGAPVGAQDVFWKESGAFTGSISAGMLANLGVTYCIVGHSETRGRFGKLEVDESCLGYFSETDETVRLKIVALLAAGIAPILCVGETLAEREAGNTDAVIQGQLSAALMGISSTDASRIVVAYEPVWAIGTGKTCDTPEAERVCGMIRSSLTGLVDGAAEEMRILYGGSVKAANAADLFAQPNIDGGLVGGASLIADEFKAIIQAAK